jgi:hypothetical protein
VQVSSACAPNQIKPGFHIFINEVVGMEDFDASVLSEFLEPTAEQSGLALTSSVGH